MIFSVQNKVPLTECDSTRLWQELIAHLRLGDPTQLQQLLDPLSIFELTNLQTVVLRIESQDLRGTK